MKNKGFTLIELLVVIMIIGILVAVGMPQYQKVVENSKAESAEAVVNMIGQANRMYGVNNTNSWDAEQLSSGASLVSNNYLAAQDWTNSCYTYYSCNPSNGAGGGCCASGIVACSERKTSGGSCNTSVSPYSTWGYTVSNTGVITAENGAPAPTN